MGWQTSNPGGTYTKLTTKTTKQNYYSLTYTVSYARRTNNQISVKVECALAGKGQYDQGPYYPSYQYFNTGSDSVFPAGTQGNTRYWVGTLNQGSTKTFNLGYSNSNTTMDGSVFFNITVTGPAYTSKYSITYNGNGNNSGSTAAQTDITYNSSATLRANGFVKTGYNFIGWNTNAAGTGSTYQPGTSLTVTGNVTLYAMWQQITYSVTYNGNGNTGGSTASQAKYWGTALTLRANGFTRTNYTFQHWNTKADGSGTSYAAGASYTANAAVTLYAIWKKNNIPVFINDEETIIQVEKAFINDGGTIKECIVYQNLNGTIVTYQ